ncbi:hypothetical protein HX804_03595 [Marine Group I thaumarchaeote]|uniref:Uncharacterized protein n=1 Tax=Marine Group I thaumarchaeote TaxID=2511932 RepID=A0A7K4NP30_9ARCH|nr:hypothetical protein [Marine Group I thaumarchaeote]
MPKSPTIDDISEDYEIRPRDRERVLQILEKLDQSGNARFLDDREIITRALEVFLTWELEPKKFLDELKKVKLTQSQENALAAILDPKSRNDSGEFYSTEVEHKAQQSARERTGDLESMYENLKHSQDRLKQLDYPADIDLQHELNDNNSTEIKYDGWPLIWNFYSRLLPAKITLTALGNMMNTKESLWVDLREFRVTAYDIAEEFVEDIRNYERIEKKDRTERLSTGFPKPLPDPNKETARLVEKRFKDKYAANIRKNTKTGEHHLEGALTALGLITVKKYQNEHYVTMTDLGREFYLLDNPHFNPNEEKFIAFYPKEVECIREKLIPQRELENELCKKALEIVSSVDNQEDQIKKLGEEFESTIRKFVKSYNGWPVIKERLEKEYGIMASEDICIKDELDGCSISLEGADDENREELEGEVQELVDIEKRIEACRVATMGRLSELGLIKWKIGPNTSSEYTIVKKG